MNDVKLAAQRAAKRTMVFGIVSGALIAVYGLWISRGHITHVGYMLRLTPFEAETLFVLVDFLAIYGKVLTNRNLKAKTRRIGYRLMAIGLVLSFGCNIVSGVFSGGYGAAAYGAFVVGIIVLIEYAIANTEAKSISLAPRKARTVETELTPRQISARKGAETRRRNAAAPVSPGVGPVGDYAGRKA